MRKFFQYLQTVGGFFKTKLGHPLCAIAIPRAMKAGAVGQAIRSMFIPQGSLSSALTGAGKEELFAKLRWKSSERTGNSSKKDLPLRKRTHVGNCLLMLDLI
jgi:hypothetical protein